MPERKLGVQSRRHCVRVNVGEKAVEGLDARVGVEVADALKAVVKLRSITGVVEVLPPDLFAVNDAVTTCVGENNGWSN
jgi:hypothetical protein